MRDSPPCGMARGVRREAGTIFLMEKVMNLVSGFRWLAGFTLTVMLPALPHGPIAAQVVESSDQIRSADAVVHELYDMVTFPAGTTPDWDEFRALFLPESVVVLRSSREATSVFTLDGFVEDWLRFIDGSNIEETGFTERVIRTHSTEFGDIAHVWVLYEAEIPGLGRPPQAGVDSFQLVRREGSWKIASITNEIPTPDRPIPLVLRGEG
jgi:hypothetical protein